MKKIEILGFTCHPRNPMVPELMPRIISWAENTGTQVHFELSMAQVMNVPALGLPLDKMSEKAEVIVVLGGDGTILQALRTFAGDDIPIAGINLGHLGFLTLGTPMVLEKLLNRLRSGKYSIETRLMLESRVIRDGQQVQRGIAANDIVIIKEPISRVIDVHVSISGTPITSFRGDGVIFSSPTGSTAYSLSAGGPIIPPWVDAMLICPLASHTLSTRPVVTSDKEIFLATLSGSHSKVELVLDGQEGIELFNGDRIQVSRAKENASIVVLQERNFFEILRKKMQWGK